MRHNQNELSKIRAEKTLEAQLNQLHDIYSGKKELEITDPTTGDVKSENFSPTNSIHHQALIALRDSFFGA
jgi:hypothetical protein